MSAPIVTRTVERHAAHYANGANHHVYGRGHDLEVFTFASELHVKPAEIPADATFDVGYRENGVQHWRYSRRLPLSAGTCPRCEECAQIGGAL